jgi:hypothetical protein
MTLDIDKITETLILLKSLPKIKEVKELTKRLQLEENRILAISSKKQDSVKSR